MELREIQKKQLEFDKEYFKKFWDIKNDKIFIERLQYIVVALVGEIGEYANIVKKISRDYENLNRNNFNQKREELIEELVDCFIYLIIAANLLDIDLEREFLKKLEKNKKRFEKYKDG
ncbi:MAG: nucleotide pyrophosphohydrolase [Candidatus Aenigmarchaeota archaeon]|nr:nucleotide pyrophosphohydrolase [Candidatus Aenigmarchaeota archaeon]